MKNGAAEAIKRIEQIDRHYEEIRSVRQLVNEIIEQHIPGEYKDGDVRIIPSNVFESIMKHGRRLREMECDPFNSPEQAFIPSFVGSHGTLYFAPTTRGGDYE